MNKKIITIAEIAFALIFVVLLAALMGTLSRKATSDTNKLIDTLGEVSDTEINFYNNTIMKGEAVINAINNIESIGDGKKLNVLVKTKSNTTGKSYGFTDASSTAITTYNLTVADSTNNDYINPTGTFKATLNENTNKVITGITFTQQ